MERPGFSPAGAGMSRVRVWLGPAGLTAVMMLSACNRPVPSVAPLALAVEGRANRTPSIAADGPLVAVAWTAVGDDGRADAYVAVSRDAGVSFAPPVRVNDADGEVRASQQQAPRIAVHAGSIVVLWTARRDGAAEIRLAMSKDGGRSFSASTEVSADGAAGIRGWGSIVADPHGRLHAVWLDTRLAAGADTPKPTAKPTGGHAHHGAEKSSTRQDVYAATLGADGTVAERLVATDVCFCCKTAVGWGGAGLWAAWRGVYDDDLRDITFARLDDETAKDGVRVSEDGWQIRGCPEDGPAMAADGNGRADLVWPTLVSSAPSAKGVFHAATTDGRTFSPRFRLDAGAGSASHPSVALAASGALLAVWELTDASGNRIEARGRSATAWAQPRALTATGTASSPAVAAVGRDFVVAWERADGEGSRIELVRVSAER
jgi:hypothetical protein